MGWLTPPCDDGVWLATCGVVVVVVDCAAGIFWVRDTVGVNGRDLVELLSSAVLLLTVGCCEAGAFVGDGER